MKKLNFYRKYVNIQASFNKKVKKEVIICYNIERNVINAMKGDLLTIVKSFFCANG